MLLKYISSLPDYFEAQFCIFIFLKISSIGYTCKSLTANVIHFLNRFYYGGLTLMKLIVKMLLKEISKGYILILHHIFLISTQEHHIPVKEKRRPLK